MRKILAATFSLSLALSTLIVAQGAEAITATEVGSYLSSSSLPMGVAPRAPRTFLMGDSTLAALNWEPNAQSTLDGLDYVLDAESCRAISIQSCRGRPDPATGGRLIPDNALTVIGDQAPNSFDELVMMIGYDESSATFAKSLPLVLSLAKAKGYKHVTWLTFHVNGGYQPPLDGDASYRSNNAVLLNAVHPADGFLTLLDWDRYADDIGGLIQSDGAHLEVKGAYAVGDLIHSALDLIWGPTLSSPPAKLAHPQQAAEPGGYVLSNTPSRLLDTREQNGQIAGGEAVRIEVPNGQGMSAAVVNLTAVRPTDAGFFTAYSCTSTVPNVSSLNFDRLETRAAATIVTLDADGGFCLASSDRAHAIVDLLGLFDPAQSAVLTPQTPSRAFDSRATKVKVAANRGVLVPLAMTGVSGVSLIVTATDASADGWLAVSPVASDGTCHTPTTSNLNFAAKTAVANAVAVPVNTARAAVCLYASTTLHVIVDVMGSLSASTAKTAPDPSSSVADARWAPSPANRLLDTRQTVGRQARAALVLPPTTHAVTVTAVNPTSAGFVTVYPSALNGACGEPPTTSILNLRAGGAAANMTFVDPSRTLCLAASTPVDFVVDAL